MKEFDKDFVLEKIKQLGIVNVIVIFVFLLALVYFIFYSFGYIGRKIFTIDKNVEVYYDLSNVEKYEINSEDEAYKCSLIVDYNTFYNVEEIVNNLLKRMQANEYKNIVNVFSKDMKKYYGNSDEEFINMLKKFYDSYVSISLASDEICVDKIYNIDNTNIYICYLKNIENIEKKIVLNVDTSEMTYKIENIDF